MVFPRFRFLLVSSLLLTGASVVFAAPKPAPFENSATPTVTSPAPAPAQTAPAFPKISTPAAAPKVSRSKVAAPKVAASKTSKLLKAVAKAKIARPFRLIVPAMGLDIPVVSGTGNDALRLAPGYDPFSALPGEAGNCVVASHRNVHGAYFWYLTKVKPGALITVQTPRETFTYQVVSAGVVPESQTNLLENHLPAGAPARLTLYTCTLPVSPRRVVVVANQIARGVSAPGAFDRPAVVPEITSGPLRLLKDKTLHERYQSLLRYAQVKEKVAPLASSIESGKVAAKAVASP